MSKNSMILNGTRSIGLWMSRKSAKLRGLTFIKANQMDIYMKILRGRSLIATETSSKRQRSAKLSSSERPWIVATIDTTHGV